MKKHVCPWWFAYTFDNPLRRLFHDPEKLFSAYLQEGMTAIDIGCGMGYFSIGMAKMVGQTGKVIAVDVQKKMLDTLAKRAGKAGVANRITTVLCDDKEIGSHQAVDFALMFWMLHEVPDALSYLQQVHAILKPSARLLLAEPKRHVSLGEFQQQISMAQQVGYTLIAQPPISFSYSALFEKIH